ncbi:MAG: GGDEF domain-containing protein [Thiotrichales bacterium]|nr:GGDEF domain-containing protein [Thiotrichales bacterium]
MIRKWILLWVVLLLASCSNSQDKLKISATTWVGYSPLFYAKAKGWLDPLKIQLLHVVSLSENRYLYQAGNADTYGHEVGDIVLKQIAEIVDLHSRHSDVFARWGGEEFVLVVCDSDLEQAMKVAEVLRARIAESHSDSRPDVTASFGVAQVNQGDDLESLIKRADAAMYQAKQNGRNQVYSLT